MFLQLVGTAMCTKFAPPYACLSVGYLEETILFPRLLPLHFTLTECKLIEEIFKRFIDDGFVLWPKNANIDVFRKLLNVVTSLTEIYCRKKEKIFVNKTLILLYKF